MATVKINYGGTTYSMVKTPTKITTPSIKVDDGYIPCFKGDRFSEVLNGSLYYTLSPVCANGYRLACGTRTGFSGNVDLTLNFNITFEKFHSGHTFRRKTSVNYNSYSVSTTQSGFTVAISNFKISPTSASDSSHKVTLNATCSGNVTVKDSLGNAVKSFSFSKSISFTESDNSTGGGTGAHRRSKSQTYRIG